MASLKEIKARIASVQSTLKITSAMKMVASAKLHKVQGVAASLAEYERRLADIAAALTAEPAVVASSPLSAEHEHPRRAIVVAFASDSSLCGAFNANATRELAREIEALRAEGFSEIEVWPAGEKIAQASLKAGYSVRMDFRRRGAMPAYDDAAEMARQLMERYLSGAVDRVRLVYNHFYSMGHQAPRSETFLPADFSKLGASETAAAPVDYIYEPDAARLLEALIPYTVRIRMYEVMLDSMTAEHAARMVAMQTATDNAQELLGDLTLTYNKRRQQAITDELADITQAE